MYALRQGVADIADFFADRVPNIGYVRRFGIVFDLKNDERFAWLGVAADLVGERHLLQRALDFVGDLLGHLLRRGARPVGAHDHRAESEWRVFVLAELEIGGKA